MSYTGIILLICRLKVKTKRSRHLKIVPAIGLAKKVRIVVGGDMSIMSYCEQNGLYYCFGLAKNAVLKGLLEYLREDARA